MQRICMAAKNDEVYFAYLVAMPRQRFNFRKVFSTRCLILCADICHTHADFLLLRGGITMCIHGKVYF